MMRVLFSILTCLACVACVVLGGAPARAGAPIATAPSSAPDADEIRRVLAYYYGNATAAPLLIEAKLCTEIGTEGDLKNECIHEVKSLSSETDTYLWLNFMVPKGAPDQKILIQFNHDGITRQAREATLRSALRYRTWKKFRPDRTGKWMIQILHDSEAGANEMERIDLDVGTAPVAKAGTQR